jgi:hypothetical protein
MKNTVRARTTPIIRIASHIAAIVVLMAAFSLTGCEIPPYSTTPTVITIKAIEGVTVPVTEAVPVTKITPTEQYTGTVVWIPADNTFKASAAYTALITLKAKEGYTLEGVAANFFTVAGASTVSNEVNSGVVIAVFNTKADDQTPVADDYDIGNLTQTAGNITAVTITAKEGKSSGAVTIYYEGTDGTTYPKSTTLPTAAGTYTVTFNVAAVTGWDAASGLSAGTLTINQYIEGNKTPTVDDYDIDNLDQRVGSITAVTITSKTGKSSGAVTIYYNGSTTLPTTGGTYAVTFDVAAASGLSAGTLNIYPKNITSLEPNPIQAQTYTGNAITPTVTAKDGSTTLTLNTDYTVRK